MQILQNKRLKTAIFIHLKMSVSSPFKFLVNYTHDDYAESAGYFILRPHQTIPKYYLFANKNLNKILLHYSMGSGKTASAIFVFLYYLDNNIKKTFNNKFLYPDMNIKIKPNVIIIASWMTWQQIDTELINHPEFNIITPEQRKILDQLERSTLDTDKDKERSIKREIFSLIHKYIKYVGYQGFFNLLFPEKNIAKYGQSIESLVEEYKNNTLKPSMGFLKSLENTVIVVDEMQKLYSSFGLNTYGFAVSYISKHAAEIKCKIIFMTGTMINSSIGEIPDILNVISDEKKWIDREEYCIQDTILNDIPIWKFNKTGEKKSISLLKDRFLFYDQKADEHGNNVGELTNLNDIFFPNEKTLKMLTPEMEKQFKYCQFVNTQMKAIRFSKFPMLPREYHIGNRLIAGTNEEQPLILYAIECRGLQKNALSKDIQESDESEMIISPHDAVIPPASKYNELGIYKQDNVFRGRFLSLDNLWKYSAIGYEICCLCILNTLSNEKTVLYHNKLNSFGIKQYAAILGYNGFIKYGSQPLKDSICKSCGRTYADHSLKLEERLKIKACNEFKPCVYDYLTGDLDTSERMYIVKEVYNNPLNTNGDMISVLFISDVAYAGVNLLSTHNIIFLSKVNNISKWKQIYNRIVRVNSHAMLPEEKQYAKIYTMIVGDDIKAVTKTISDDSLLLEEKYYKKNIILNTDISKYIEKLSKESISDILFNYPDKITFEISRDLLVMFMHDIDSEFNNIIMRSTPTYNAAEWELDVYLNRLQDKKLSLSFIDFSLFTKKFLIRLVQRNRLVTLFRYNSPTIYIRIERKQLISRYQIYNTFKFSQLRQLEDKKKSLQILLKQLRNEKSIAKKSTVLYTICKMFSGKFDELMDVQEFWEEIYEIADEYYDDDEHNFFRNHSTKNRSQGKVAGFYYGNNIVLKNGEIRKMPITYLTIEGVNKHPYIYRIVSIPDKGIIGENSPFYLHVKLIKKSEVESIDRRKISSGVSCFTMNIDEIKKYFPKIKISTEIGYKRIFCKELIGALCEEQCNEKQRFVYSPFEHF